MTQVRIGVLGGSDTVGRHAVAALERRGHEVRVLARSTGADVTGGGMTRLLLTVGIVRPEHRDRVRSLGEEQNMTKTYRRTPVTRVANRIFSVMTRRGRGADYRYILTVEGRKSGVARSTPVDVVEVDGQRWLVAPYGEVNWVKNARASGQVDLSRGGTTSRWKAEEIHGLDAVPAIRCYISSVPVTAAYWEVAADSPDEAVSAASEQHPVFRLAPLPSEST